VTWHPTDDDLVLHFYGEGAEVDEPTLERHLASCEACHMAWSTLQQTMRMVDAADVPEPDPGFERVMWARVQQALPDRRARISWWSWRGFAPVAGLVVVIIMAFTVGRMWSRWQQTPGPAPATASARATAAADAGAARERVLLTALGDHFEQSKVLLVELMNAPDAGHIDFGYERAAAGDLVMSSRLYRQTAQQNGDVRLAQVLEDLESVLVEVARSPDTVDRKDFEALRARIDSEGLLFKVRAVSNDIQQRQNHSSTVTEGEL
jgi:hypothetical protein